MSATSQMTYTAPNGAVFEKKPARYTERLYKLRLKNGGYSLVDGDLQRRCARCREYFPADSEFFYASANEKDGLHCWCKACYQEWRYPNGRKKAA